ncbi:MAG: HTH-type transcriptional regulator MalT [Betaproteobacteria bacterium ADurb.Bin341]|nr:MAG: HTH-type transcriptional regulator MalT [Betaproteobacteria bacterium ADurb.Bin341]
MTVVKYSFASSAKTSRPVAHVVRRPAVVEAMKQSQGALFWLVAPAGSGKTSLCLDYLQDRGCPSAWVRLDEADRDPASFFYYLEQAILSGGIASDWRAPTFLPEHLQAPGAYTRLFLRSLAPAIAPDACLVLDDAYNCQDAPFFGEFLRIVQDELPPGVHILICSRAAPPAVCAKALAYGAMVEIDSARLSFSQEETERLLAVLGVEDAAGKSEAVFEASQGWAVAIVLMATWLQRRPEAARNFEEHLPNLVGSFLATEVFEAYSSPERELLLAICWLPYFREDWAASLSGVETAGEIIARLVASGLVYEYSGRQYSLHRLFRTFLREWACINVAEEKRLQWVDQSVLLMLSDDDADVAVELALKYGLFERAAALIENQSADLFEEGRHQTLERWIESLPQHLHTPWHDYWLGLSLFTRDAARSREALLRAYVAFSDSDSRQNRYMALSWIVSTYALNNLKSDVPLVEVLSEYIGSDDYERLTDDNLRAHLAQAVFSGLALTDPGHPDFCLWQQRSEDALALPASQTIKIRILAWLAILSFLSGRYRRMDELCALLDGLPDLQELSPHAQVLAQCIRALAMLVHADHAALPLALKQARRLSTETGIINLDGINAMAYAVSRVLAGDVEGGGAILQEALAANHTKHYFMGVTLELAQSWITAWKGSGSSLQFAHIIRQTGRDSGLMMHEILGLTSECIAAALLDLPDLAARVAELRRLGNSGSIPYAAIHAELLDAWRLARAGDEEAAVPFLETGLKLLRQQSEGFLTSAVPQILQPLCALALRRNIEPDTARALIRVFGLPPPPDFPAYWTYPVQIRCFGGFELLIGGRSVPSQGKSKHRQMELIRMIAAHAPTPLAMGLISEILWPDSEGDAAHHALETTLSRLRTTLGYNIFIVEHGAVSLDRQFCWLDTVVAHEAMLLLEKQVKQKDRGMAATAQTLLDLCRGELLFGEGAAWIVARREYWNSRMTRAFSAVAAALVASGAAIAAARLLARALEINPHSELVVHDLMDTCLKADLHAEGLAAYQRFCRFSLPVLGIAVPEKIELLAQRLRKGGNE